MLVNDGVEGQSVLPGGGEVAHVHVVVASSLHLAPAHFVVVQHVIIANIKIWPIVTFFVLRNAGSSDLKLCSLCRLR